MLLFIIFLSFVVYSSHADNNLRIVNGKDANEGEYSFMVSLRDKNNNHFCGGTILNANHILTAAHCLCDPNMPEPPYSIQYGSVYISKDDARSIQVSNFICHEQFFSDDNPTSFDVAVLKLESPIPQGNWNAVELSDKFTPSLLTNGVIVGWGRIWEGGPTPRVLQKLDVNVLLDAICGLHFNKKHHICLSALFSGACDGDSGSALIVNGRQVGIASFITSHCGSSSMFAPNVYARVSTYLEWINNIAGLK